MGGGVIFQVGLLETTYFGRIVCASEFHESTRCGGFLPFGKIGLHQTK